MICKRWKVFPQESLKRISCPTRPFHNERGDSLFSGHSIRLLLSCTKVFFSGRSGGSTEERGIYVNTSKKRIDLWTHDTLEKMCVLTSYTSEISQNEVLVLFPRFPNLYHRRSK